MMADIQELIEGLRRADAAGNEADAKRFAQAIEQATSEQQSAKPESRGFVDRAADATSKFLNGVTFGYSDEIQALMAEQLGYGQYPELVEQSRKRTAEFDERNPYVSPALEFAGGIATSLTPIGAIGQATKAPLSAANLARAAGTGAGWGALYGYGEGEGGVSNRLANIPKNAVIGAAGGAAGNVLQAAVGRLTRALGDPEIMASEVIAPRLNVRPETYRVAREAAQIADANLDGGAMDFVRRGGPGAMAGDVMPGPLDSVANVGAGAPIASRNLNRRVDAASRDVAAATNKALGQPRGRKEIVREIMDSTRAGRKAAYDEAFDTPINYAAPGGREIEDVLQRIDPDVLRRAMRRAEAEMRDMKYPNRQFKINILDDGEVVIDELPNVLQMDQLKRALDDVVREGTNKIEGTVSAEARLASRHAREIREALVANNENYAKALAAGKDAISQREARALGAKLLDSGTYVEDIAEALADATPADVTRIKQGLRSEMAHRLGNVRRTRTDPNIDQRQAMKSIADLTTPNNKEKMTLLLGDDEAAAFFREIDEAANAFNVRAETARNSKTAGRQSFENRIVEEAGRGRLPETDPRNLVTEVGSLPARGMNMLLGKTSGQIMNRSRGMQVELAELLTGRTGQDALDALELLLADATRASGDYQGRLSQLLARNTRVATPQVLSPTAPNRQ